jgi:hypothetical protein
MGTAAFKAAFERGEPLADFTLKFRAGVDAVAAVDRINVIYEDLHIHPLPWYDHPQIRIGCATKDALVRIFGWALERMPLSRYDEETRSWGHYPNAYLWGECTKPDLTRPDWGSLVEDIGLSQPGASDDGQWRE